MLFAPIQISAMHFGAVPPLELQNNLDLVGSGEIQHKEARKPIFWYHIHKAGGSTACDFAKANHERTPRMDPVACNLPHRPSGPTCADVAADVKRQNITWFQWEEPLYPNLLCPDQFSTGVMLRDPFKLAQSQANFVDARRWYREHLDCISKGGNACHELTAKAAGHMAYHASHLWTFFDNFLIRNLGGDALYNLPANSINSTHLEAVKRTLLNFDYVLFLEDFESGINQRVFEQCIGFSNTTAHSNSMEYHFRFSSEEEEYIRSQSKYDYALVRYFQDLPLTERGRSMKCLRHRHHDHR